MLCGELELASGTIERNYATLSYAAQDPWLIGGNVRENILMGEPYNKSRYDEVVEACCLLTDFAQLRTGDMTIVGDRGVQLSGGQRARIGLARALYRPSHVVLLDDPLSAVDARVGRVIFYEAILGLAVRRGKCVVLATHQHQFVGEQRCVLVAGGKIECVGSYSECVSSSMGKIRKSVYNTEESTTSNDEEKKPDDRKEEDVTRTTDALNEDANDQEEIKAQGVVKMDTFIKYGKAMGGPLVAIFLIVLFSVTQATVLATVAAFGKWSEKPADEQTSRRILSIVVGLGVVVIVLAVIRAFSSFALFIKASRVLHDRMTSAVLRAKISFFDTNPLGRILNRFSADVGSNDDMVCHTNGWLSFY